MQKFDSTVTQKFDSTVTQKFDSTVTQKFDSTVTQKVNHYLDCFLYSEIFHTDTQNLNKPWIQQAAQYIKSQISD